MAMLIFIDLIVFCDFRAFIVFDKRNELEISSWAVKDEQSFNFVTPNLIFIRDIVLEFWFSNPLLGLSFLFFDQIFPKRYIRRYYNYLTRKINSYLFQTFHFFVIHACTTRVGSKLLITERILNLWAFHVILLLYTLCLRINKLRLCDRTFLECRHSPIIKTTFISWRGDLLLDRKISILFLFCSLS